MIFTDSDIIWSLVEKYGSPLYIFKENDFLLNYHTLFRAFSKEYDNYAIAYSYKTNYTPYICNLVKENGGYAEVVSDMEYTLAKKIGYENNRIIYNGPCKGKLLEEHVLHGGLFNIDNEEETCRIIDIAKRNKDTSIKVGIRVNSDVGAGFVSRFGIELDSPSFINTVSLLNQIDNIKLVGLHCHISRARGLNAWQRRINNLLEAADKYIDGIPEYIDLGSGMFGDMDVFLKEQFDSHIPTYEEYATVVAGTMASHYSNSIEKPLLFTEPGTTLVSKYLSLISTVNNIKTIGNKSFATLDSSFYNVGEMCLMKKLPYKVIHSPNQDTSFNELVQNNRIDITGYTCLEQDCIYSDFPESLFVGDLVVFSNIGGYSIVSKPPFIEPNCRILCYTKEEDIKEIKRAEEFDDIFGSFIFN